MWQQITYPPPNPRNFTIGVTAPSSGVPTELHPRLNFVMREMENQGVSIKEGACLRQDEKAVSGSANNRAKDFMDLWCDPEVHMIVPPWGGELIINILNKLDFDLILRHPKWILGYSDISTLLFAITIKTGVCTAHGLNLMDNVPSQSDPLTRMTYDLFRLKRNASFVQKSSERYQNQFPDYEELIKTPFVLDQKTIWKSLNDKNVQMDGRLIGGCLGTLRNLIGTDYGDIPKFVYRFKDQKLLLYFENAQLSPYEVSRALWNMRYAGWFDQISGIIFGRSSATPVEDFNELNYKEALGDCLGSLDLPVVFDVDIGHKPPQMTLFNGCYASFNYYAGKGDLTQKFI